MLFLAGLGIIAFFIGTGFMLNNLLFSLPKKSLTGKSDDTENRHEIDSNMIEPVHIRGITDFTSVAKETTRHLISKIPTK